jgi:Tol biopolymer transport system component
MSTRSGNAEISRISPGDTSWVNLTNDPAGDNWPEWSPDGSQIVFHSDRNGKYDVFVMNADGSGLAQITTHEDHDYVPAWTPDGRIVFTSWRREPADTSRASHVYLMNSDGTGQERLELAGGAPVTGARFAADGRTIVYGQENPDETADLYLATLDDLAGRKITTGDAYYGDPAFSPDGRWVAYYADRAHGSDLLIQDIASAAVDTALSGGSNWYPRFSPDGRWMLSCTETSHGNYDVLYFPLDASAPAHPLVASRRRDCEGRWSPVITPAAVTP